MVPSPTFDDLLRLARDPTTPSEKLVTVQSMLLLQRLPGQSDAKLAPAFDALAANPNLSREQMISMLALSLHGVLANPAFALTMLAEPLQDKELKNVAGSIVSFLWSNIDREQLLEAAGVWQRERGFTTQLATWWRPINTYDPRLVRFRPYFDMAWPLLGERSFVTLLQFVQELDEARADAVECDRRLGAFVPLAAYPLLPAYTGRDNRR